MIKVVIEFRGGTMKVAEGIEAMTLPYVKEIIGTSYEKREETLVIFGSYHGEASVIFSLENVNNFSVYNFESKELIVQYDRDWSIGPEIVFKCYSERYRIQLKFITPDILGQCVPIGDLSDIMPKVEKIINISGTVVCRDGKTLVPVSTFALFYSDNQLLMQVDREELMGCPVHVIIEYEKRLD